MINQKFILKFTLENYDSHDSYIENDFQYNPDNTIIKELEFSYLSLAFNFSLTFNYSYMYHLFILQPILIRKMC